MAMRGLFTLHVITGNGMGRRPAFPRGSCFWYTPFAVIMTAGKQPGADDMEPEEDQAKMTLVEHLDELRRRILYALLGLVVGMGLTAYFHMDIIDLLKLSYDEVTRDLGIDSKLVVLKHSSGLVMVFRVVLLRD